MKSSYSRRQEDGFIMAIIVIIAAIVLLKFWFGWNVIDFLKSPKVVEVTNYIREVVSFVWTHYLSGPAQALWNFILNSIVSLISSKK